MKSVLISSIFWFLCCYVGVSAQNVLRSSTGNWEAEFQRNGGIKSLKMKFGDDMVSIPWHSSGEYAGPYIRTDISHNGFYRVAPFSYMMKDMTLVYSISYLEEKGNFVIRVGVKNVTNNVQTVECLSLRLGINHIMEDPTTYYSIFFPTLLRCEKSHLWGYFQTPNGQVLAIGSDMPIASWHLDYIGKGHRIGTSELDLLHKQPLPARHPQNLFYLEPKEEKVWDIVLLPLENIHQVPMAIASACEVPTLNVLQTTVAPGEYVDFDVYSSGKSKSHVSLLDASGKDISDILVKKESETSRFSVKMPDDTGMYRINVSVEGKQADASIYVRKKLGWYLEQARDEALRMEQKTGQNRESWMGFFSAYWAHVYAPDPKRLEETELKFEDFWNRMIDPKTRYYYTNRKTWHSRPQNTSWMLGVLVARYAATKKIKHLELAAEWADFLIDKYQLPNGAYKGYTALTLGAQFLQELMWYEYPLSRKDKKWEARYKKHEKSILRAGDNLLIEKDLGETEGQSTYEDSQAGSAWSLLAMHAMISHSRINPEDFLRESLAIQKRHECLTQALIPDARMRGGTLRWWEAQYDVLINKNMMNSPHAWTMRSQFGAIYLYLLTGEEYYLNVATNVIGSCIQAIDHYSGQLRWGFIPDPYVEIKRFVPDYRSDYGKYVDDVIGEQWLPMISDWWRTNENEYPLSTEKGWSCDNDVHEHFRFLAEQFIPNAFVLERQDGTIRTWNCTAEFLDGKLTVTFSDKAVSRVHFNMKRRCEVRLDLNGCKRDLMVDKGMRWFGPGLKDYQVPAVYLWKEMIDKK